MVSLLEWCVILVGLGLIMAIRQLVVISSTLGRALGLLKSLDAEVFHLAQEQNPEYGVCSECGRRTTVRYVVPNEPSPDSAELFYCQACWWMSSSVRASDEIKHYKDRLSDEDRLAARVGPA